MRTLLLLPSLMALLAAAPAAALTLKIATLSPEGTSWMKNMRAAGEEIERQTQGRVRLRFFPGGVMGNYASVLRKIRIGQLHGGAVTGGSLSDVLPEANLYSLPFLFRDLGEVDFVRPQMDAEIMRRLEEKGMVSFGFAEAGFAYLMSTAPIRTLDDAKHRRVWSPAGDRIRLPDVHGTDSHPR